MFNSDSKRRFNGSHFGRGTSRGIAAIIVAGLVLALLPKTLAVTINEFTTPTGQSGPFFIAAGPDGSLWFTEFSVGKVGRITTAGQITEFPTSSSQSTPEAITLGPDGNLWFSESGINMIGRISPSGRLAEFPLPRQQTGEIAGMTAGPDGAIWFTEGTSNMIGRITTDQGRVTEFPVPTQGGFPLGITRGPDGALWFTEKNVAKIGRLTTVIGAGASIMEFPLPDKQNIPNFITTGPDGNLWFTEGVIVTTPVAIAPDGSASVEPEAASGQIGRITTAGAIMEFPVPTSLGGPNGITAGPDGALWFTETALAGNKIGRITTAGSIMEFPINTPSSQPIGITTGPDGNLWFTEANVSKIGKLVPDAPQGKADLSVTASAGASAATGTQLTYTVNVANAGPDTALNVVVTAPVPVGGTFASVSGGSGATFTNPPVGSPGSITATYKSLAPSASASFQFAVNVLAAAGGTLSSTVTVMSSVSDPNTANNTATVSTQVQGGAVVRLFWTPPVSTATNPTPGVTDLQVSPGTSPRSETVSPESLISPDDATCALIGYNLYESTAEPVFAPSNLKNTVTATSSTPAPVAPTGATLFVITTLWDCGGVTKESVPSNVASACGGPTITKVTVGGKLKAFGSGYMDGVQVFINGVGFMRPAVFFSDNPLDQIQVKQKGPLTDGTFMSDLPPGVTVLVTFKQPGSGGSPCFSSIGVTP